MNDKANSFELIAASPLSEVQLKLITEAMGRSVDIFPEDSRTRNVYMQGALMAVVGIKNIDEVTEQPIRTTFKL
jgi:Pyruvate/2-oxoacid:ferredoxin oxidoreductase gamma subunit